MKVPIILFLLLISFFVYGKEYHVSLSGNDKNKGELVSPLKTISKAAQIAKPGDIVTVHKGVYREWINPIASGSGETKRIVYQAAHGEEVVIKGSDEIKGWQKVNDEVWKVKLPNCMFGNYNPYQIHVGGDWFINFKNHRREQHTGEVYLNGSSLFEVDSLSQVFYPIPLEGALDSLASKFVWWCNVDSVNTTIWANFHGSDPNKELVEINVRPACFYPKSTGINFITVKGFHMSQAATNWAAPSAEQIGLIGTNWSKGWIIENNIISDSKCTGITLGKDSISGNNVASKDLRIDATLHFIEVIFKAIKFSGWSKERIGWHIVRNNTIYNCEEAGICGSLGAIFSQVYKNHIYNIWIKRQFGGPEIAGIKFHAPIDGIIRNNRVHNAFKGIWLDWMAQGTRISSNLLYDNDEVDLYMEKDHGPYLIDNNIFMSKTSYQTVSCGGALVNNLFGGSIYSASNDKFIPYHFPHSTDIAGMMTMHNGDDRYYNNIFVIAKSNRGMIMKDSKYGTETYNNEKQPSFMASNLYLNGAKPCTRDSNSFEYKGYDPEIEIEEKDGIVLLNITIDSSFSSLKNKMVSSQLLGKTQRTNLHFDNPDGSAILINSDYFGNAYCRNSFNIGPFSGLKEGRNVIRVW